VIVVLNGPPRAGKSSIAEAIQETFAGVWVNLGVDVARRTTPPVAQPGIGLRPGEAAHPAAPVVRVLWSALWESIAAHARLGLDVVADVGLHDADAAADGARRLAGLSVLFVGVRCPVDVAIARRSLDPGTYATGRTIVERWEREVHRWHYDLEVDTSAATPAECAAAIADRLVAEPPPTAFFQLATVPA
jgi:chloramphenicol 3-O phosphotransferase